MDDDLRTNIEHAIIKAVEDKTIFKEEYFEDLMFVGSWVYCYQHRKPHTTGWCSVSINDKVGLGIEETGEEGRKKAYKKCKHLLLILDD